MKSIPFTQFLKPMGIPTSVWIERPDDVADKAAAIVERGYQFQCEVLTTSEISLSIHHLLDEEDVDGEIVDNGPGVPVAVDAMINRFYETLKTS